MSFLRSTVLCNCIEEGLKVPEEFTKCAELIKKLGYFDETLFEEYIFVEDVHDFYIWMQDACSHPDMNASEEKIDPCTLLHFLEKHAKRNYPELIHGLPHLIIMAEAECQENLSFPYEGERMFAEIEKLEHRKQLLAKAPEDFSKILTALKSLTKVSIQTNHPIQWYTQYVDVSKR